MYLYVRAILTGILPYAPKATRQFMDNMYESETAQDYTWIECMDSTLKLLPEEVLVEYSTKYADRIKPVSEYVSSLAANLIDTSLQSFMAYGGYSDKKYTSLVVNLKCNLRQKCIISGHFKLCLQP